MKNRAFNLLWRAGLFVVTPFLLLLLVAVVATGYRGEAVCAKRGMG